ncbi:hypothetical protein GSI_01241 [Ganoderma sinense ZZ0214-1]|uniref:Uncharacterized protein n=1 Tax=Ganoderma sinense ZZ0214-1 TaxID=1077348 RepID=A0A2G8SUV6_9APHY|nr:hypothetical protein GSI_01241 [Ganoderma sinense ZZ0214-1]
MAAITAPMQALSLDGVASPEPPRDISPTESQTPTPEAPRRKSRPDQVDPRPFPPMEEWHEVDAAGDCMYYGFYAGDDGLQKMLINCFPEHLGHKDPMNATLLYPALMFLRKHFRRRDISLATAILPQRAKDLSPEIEDEVGEHVLILGLFPLEEEPYLNRMTQAEVDEFEELMGTKPTWYRVAHLMSDI